MIAEFGHKSCCLDIGDSPMTAEAVRHPTAWFEN